MQILLPVIPSLVTHLRYMVVQLAEDGGLDWNSLMGALKPQTKCALIQRSCGYSWRRTLSVSEIARAIEIIKVKHLGCVADTIVTTILKN